MRKNIITENIECNFQMEKYSAHLEVLVAERTAELEVEKLKTDRLLYSTFSQTNVFFPFMFLGEFQF